MDRARQLEHRGRQFRDDDMSKRRRRGDADRADPTRESSDDRGAPAFGDLTAIAESELIRDVELLLG